MQEKDASQPVISHEELLASLKMLVSEACQAGNVQSELDSESVTIRLRFQRGPGGDLDFVRSIAALLAQETC